MEKGSADRLCPRVGSYGKNSFSEIEVDYLNKRSGFSDYLFPMICGISTSRLLLRALQCEEYVLTKAESEITSAGIESPTVHDVPNTKESPISRQGR